MITATLSKLANDKIMPDEFDNLDLEPIKYKLMNPHDTSKAWSLEKCDQIAEQYKMFLYLCKVYPSQGIVPTTEIDEFWHQHILDTLKYADDCQKIYGYFLHHFPYFGLRGVEDAQALADFFEKTRALFAEHFNFQLCLDAEAESCRDDCVSLSVGNDTVAECMDSGSCTYCTNSCSPDLSSVIRPRPAR
jgi:hypothetical protein